MVDLLWVDALSESRDAFDEIDLHGSANCVRQRLDSFRVDRLMPRWALLGLLDLV